jgi:hypothetical protein
MKKKLKFSEVDDVHNEIFNNALSVGWHLRRATERAEFLKRPEYWDVFTIWLERHLQKNYKRYDKK